MTWALAHTRARGWQVTAMHAVRESYYRRFGWECADRRVRITYPQWRFPRLTCGLQSSSCAWKTGREGVQIERSDTAEVRMHIRQYTQALLSESGFADMPQHGLVSSISARAV